MPKLDSLIVLIESMDANEKRYFQLHTKMHNGKKDYQLLFDLILQEGFSGEQIKARFKKLRPESSFEITCSHLYQTLLKKLSVKEGESDIEFRVLKACQHSRFLFKRNLYAEAFQLIEKNKAIALEYELFGPFLMLAKLEISFYNQLEFSEIDENTLVRLQSKIESVSRQQRAIENHTGLYNLISIRQIKQGTIRTDQEKEKLNDLAFNELQAVSGQLKNSFEAQKLHLLFQSAYFMKMANPKSSLKVYYELNELFENNRKLWEDGPHSYINHIKGILNNLRWFGHYDEMPFFINKMKDLLPGLSHDKYVLCLVYLFESLILTDQKKFSEALEHLEKQSMDWIDKSVALPFGSRIEMVLQIATVYFWNKEYKKGLKVIGPLLNAGKPFMQLPLFKTLRFLNILIHYELENFDYLDSEIRSFERDLLKRKKLYKSEKFILKGIKQCNNESNQMKRTLILSRQIEKLNALKNDPYENQLIESFDFIYWFETKIQPGSQKER